MFKTLLVLAFLISNVLAAENYIQVKGDAIVPTKPDIVNINFSMVTKDKSSKKAQDMNSKIMTKVIKGLTSKFSISKNDIQTTNYSMRPRYTYPRNQKPVFDGMEVDNQVGVILKNVKKIGELIDFLTTTGISNISRINFLTSKEEDLKKKALEIAYGNALEKAKSLAKEAGVTLGKAILIKESTRSHSVPRMEMMTKSMSSAPPIEGGNVKVSSSVIVNFKIN